MVWMPRSANCAESFVIEMVMPSPGLPRVIAISGEPAPRDGTAGLPLDCRVEERLHRDAPAGHRASWRVTANLVGMRVGGRGDKRVSAGAVTKHVGAGVGRTVCKRVSASVSLQACVCKRVSASAWRGMDACRRGESVDTRAAAAAHSNISFARSARKLKQTKTSPSAMPPPGHTPTGRSRRIWMDPRQGGRRAAQAAAPVGSMNSSVIFCPTRRLRAGSAKAGSAGGPRSSRHVLAVHRFDEVLDLAGLDIVGLDLLVVLARPLRLPPARAAHHVVCLLDALPPLVAVHGIVPPWWEGRGRRSGRARVWRCGVETSGAGDREVPERERGRRTGRVPLPRTGGCAATPGERGSRVAQSVIGAREASHPMTEATLP